MQPAVNEFRRSGLSALLKISKRLNLQCLNRLLQFLHVRVAGRDWHVSPWTRIILCRDDPIAAGCGELQGRQGARISVNSGKLIYDPADWDARSPLRRCSCI